MELSNPLATVETTWHALVAEALDLMRATLDFCAVLGLLIGFLFGFELATQLPANLELVTALMRASLMGKLASVLVTLILSLRVITVQARAAAGTAHRDSLAAHAGACIWAAVLSMACFQFMALIGYGLGMEAASDGRGLEALDLLAGAYPLSDIPRNILRVSAEAALVAWTWHFNATFLSAHREHQSRAVTRMVLFIILAAFAIEALDSYLYWIVF
jgi:hypothetical protein